MNNPKSSHPFAATLRIPEARAFIASIGFSTLANRAMLVVLGFQIYKITRSPLALGWLGLIEAIPAIGLVLIGGYVADHYNRQKILLLTRAASCFCAAALALLSFYQPPHVILGFYTVIFLAGVARGFADPAGTAFEAQVIPKKLAVNGGSWISSTWLACWVLGPALIGFVFDAAGAALSYGIITLAFAVSWLMMLKIPPLAQPLPERHESIFKSISIGWNFLVRNQPLLGALTLDLFAVLFGGAIALLPIYAEDILRVGAKGLGFLNAAPSLGSLVVTLAATSHPPMARAGRNLLLTVFGFGISMLVFAYSKNFWLSLTALFFSGVFDGVSIVIRRAMIRLLSPDPLRGRIAAASWIFISASNELGAFESGFVAAWMGTVPCVAVGGFITLGVVGSVAWLAPQLRRLRFNPHTLEQL